MVKATGEFASVDGFSFAPGDISRIKKRFKQMPKTILRMMEKAVKKEVEDTIEEAQSNMSAFAHPSGLLERSKIIKVTRIGNGIFANFGFSVKKPNRSRSVIFDYAGVVEFGRTYRPFKKAPNGFRYLSKAVAKRKGQRKTNMAKAVRRAIKVRG